jgi:hypothetical protein
VRGEAGADAGFDAVADIYMPDAPSTDGTGQDAVTVDTGSKGGDASGEVGGGSTPAMIKATCSMYSGNKALSAADFCTLFLATCMDYIDYEPLTGCSAGPELWAMAYDEWTATQKNCRSQHLCAAAAGNASTECHSAQGVTGQQCM